MDEQSKTGDKTNVAPMQPSNPTTQQPATAQQLQATETKFEERMSAFERSMIRLTRAGVIIAGVTLIIFGGQLYEMYDAGRLTGELRDAAKDQAKAADKFASSAVNMETAVQKAVEEFHTMAESSKGSIKATQQAIRLDQRAWLVVKRFEGKLELNKSWDIKIWFRNTGKTPARYATVSCSLEPVRRGDSPTFKEAPGQPPPTLIPPVSCPSKPRR
jgi:hypothetical protein